MPKCKIDLEASPTFKKILEGYKRKYPKLLADLKDAFDKIEEHYDSAAHADAIPGFARTVWKYRWKSSDLRRGAQGGLRIIALCDPDKNSLYPLFVYSKVEKEDVSAKEIREAVEELKANLQGTPNEDR